MVELRQAVPHRHFFRHADFRQRVTFERSRVSHRLAAVMQLHIQNRARQIFHGGKSLVERVTCPNFFDEFGRDRLASLVMLRVSVEHIRRQQPVFVHLTWIFHKVARSAAKTRPHNVIIEEMDRMAEFVEQC